MTRAGRGKRSWTTRFAALAVLSLLVQLAVPPGFMLAAGEAGPQVVICTGHGPVLSTADLSGGPAKAPAGKTAPLCPFAGHCSAPTIAASLALAGRAFAYSDEAPAGSRSAEPGRGLAAPPPPSHAPPLTLA